MPILTRSRISLAFLISFFLLFNMIVIHYLDESSNWIYYLLPNKYIAYILSITFYFALYLINRLIWFKWIKNRLKKALNKYQFKSKNLKTVNLYFVAILLFFGLFLYNYWNIDLIVDQRYSEIADVFSPFVNKLTGNKDIPEITWNDSPTSVTESNEILKTPKYSEYGRFLRTYRFHEVIEKAEQHYGIEKNLLAGLIMQESFGNPLEVNSGNDGGAGLMMFQPGTAREYGLKTYGLSRTTGRDVSHGKQIKTLIIQKQNNYEILSKMDERFHVEKSVGAGAKFLATLYDRHHTWDKALSAYNRGTPAFVPSATKHVRLARYYQSQYARYLRKRQN
ncbi:MAG: transglycosylase SLT domain-containing protein [Prolixibacteraceae bacterium]|nr:transglycosylase SLT domain-containing protein [Prolixibacteraceae bacterium]